MRYVLPSGKDSRKVLGPAWTKKGRPANGYLTEGDALLKAEAFAAEHSTDSTSSRRTFRVALDAFMSHCTVEKGLRGSTLHAYRKIGERLAERPWRSDSAWADRVLDTFTADDLLAVRQELTQAERSATRSTTTAACRAGHLRHASLEPGARLGVEDPEGRERGQAPVLHARAGAQADRGGVLDDG